MPSDVERFLLDRFLPDLERLDAAGAHFILVAGQAVNFWANYYANRIPDLFNFLPFASKDVDLFGSIEDLNRIPGILSGDLKRFSDVRQPMVGVFLSDGDPPLKYELLRSIHGPVSAERITQRAHAFKPVSVIDPLSLLAAKCHNAAGIDQENRQDIKHVKMMTLVSRAYLTEVLSGVGSRITPRQFIKEVRFLLDFAEDEKFGRGITLANRVLADCLPLDPIRQAGESFPALDRFFENTLGPTASKWRHPKTDSETS